MSARDWNGRELCEVMCFCHSRKFLSRAHANSPIHLSCIAEIQGINWWLESNAAGCYLEALTISVLSASARWCLFHSIGERLEPSSRWSSNTAHKHSFFFYHPPSLDCLWLLQRTVLFDLFWVTHWVWVYTNVTMDSGVWSFAVRPSTSASLIGQFLESRNIGK